MMVPRLACLFLPLLLAVLSSGTVTPPDSPQFVYRADFREPELIFENGMKSHGTCENVYYHVEGRNCAEGTTAFISTSAQEFKANTFGRKLLTKATNMESISVYKIRPDHRFYSAYYSLATAALIFNQNKNTTGKATKYMNMAEKYQFQEEEWMAYKEIPTDLILQATTYYRRHLVNKNEQGDVSVNPKYVAALSSANKKAFPESDKGCPPSCGKL